MRLSGPRVCFVLGLAEGEFPRAAGASGLLTHTDRELLVRRGVEMPGSYENRTLLEQMYFYRAVAARAMYLSCTAAGDAQPCAALAPVLAWAGKGRAFPVQLAPHAGGGAALQRAVRPENTSCGGPARGAAKRAALPACWPPWSGRRAAALPCRGCKGAGAALGTQLTLSPTRVEQYYRCRFSYFLQYVLHILPRRRGRALAAGKRQPRALYSRARAAPCRRALCRADKGGADGPCRQHCGRVCAPEHACGGRALCTPYRAAEAQRGEPAFVPAKRAGAKARSARWRLNRPSAAARRAPCRRWS